MAFQCTVLTPEQQVLNEMITQAILPAHDGLMGVLTDRAPIMVRLGVGPLRIDHNNGTKSFFLIEGGIAQMKENTLTIITSDAIPASEIDAQAASDEYTAALARQATTPQEQAERDKALELARAKQAVAMK